MWIDSLARKRNPKRKINKNKWSVVRLSLKCDGEPISRVGVIATLHVPIKGNMENKSHLGQYKLNNLLELSKRTPHGAIIELGVYNGGTLYELARKHRTRP